MQPRFKECRADFDKNPKYFRTWVRLLSGIIRNIPGGEPLENFLDNFLHRDRNISSTRPAFLEHPDLDLGLPSLGSSTMENQGSNGEEEVSILDLELPPSINPKKYTDLDEDSIRLDKGLFNTLFTIIEGTYLHLIEDLTGEYARYTFAIIALWKHASLGSQGRRLQAMNDMEELMYHGDASKWKVDFISRTREIYSAGATIEHYIMQCAFKSFEGKNTQVQSMIAQDINDEKTIHQGMNLGPFLGLSPRSTARFSLLCRRKRMVLRSTQSGKGSGVAIARWITTTPKTVAISTMRTRRRTARSKPRREA